ncbi:MAG: hypothetical protein WCE64_16910 [Bacteroidales bacterium]
MRIKKMNGFIRLITPGRITGITLTPFGIYIKEKSLHDRRILNHEMIHWKQEMEMLIIPFYLWYFLEWLIKVFIYGKNAYSAISMEREARDNEDNPEYLRTRKRFSWVKRIVK